MAHKKDFKNDRDLEIGDLVYYQKKESELSSPWVIGKVDQVVRGRDGIIRKVIVKYINAKENFPRLTERSARKLIRIWSADDPDLLTDLMEVQARVDVLQGQLQEGGGGPGSANLGEGLSNQGAAAVGSCVLEKRCQCCCLSHCEVNFHNIYGTKSVEQYSTIEVAGLELANEMDWDNEKEEIIMEESQLEEDDDTITALIMSVGIDLA